VDGEWVESGEVLVTKLKLEQIEQHGNGNSKYKVEYPENGVSPLQRTARGGLEQSSWGAEVIRRLAESRSCPGERVLGSSMERRGAVTPVEPRKGPNKEKGEPCTREGNVGTG
jgi:hypothetical protein